jgi:hypothetical protein
MARSSYPGRKIPYSVSIGRHGRGKAMREIEAFFSEEIVLTDSIPDSLKTPCFFIAKISWIMLFREIITVCSEIYTKHTNTPCGQS